MTQPFLFVFHNVQNPEKYVILFKLVTSSHKKKHQMICQRARKEANVTERIVSRTLFRRSRVELYSLIDTSYINKPENMPGSVYLWVNGVYSEQRPIRRPSFVEICLVVFVSSCWQTNQTNKQIHLRLTGMRKSKSGGPSISTNCSPLLKMVS